MIKIIQLNSFSELPEGQYNGYHWYSDAPMAEVGSDPRMLTMEGNPFIVEGHWYDVTTSKAITYSNNGEGGRLFLVDYTDVPEAHLFTQEVLADPGLLGIATLQLTTIWAPVIDPMCENMAVLKPVKQIITKIKRKTN